MLFLIFNFFFYGCNLFGYFSGCIYHLFELFLFFFFLCARMLFVRVCGTQKFILRRRLAHSSESFRFPRSPRKAYFEEHTNAFHQFFFLHAFCPTYCPFENFSTLIFFFLTFIFFYIYIYFFFMYLLQLTHKPVFLPRKHAFYLGLCIEDRCFITRIHLTTHFPPSKSFFFNFI